ncbi:MAG: helix-turn-helix domain-containing protein [Sphaerochaeta sp.]
MSLYSPLNSFRIYKAINLITLQKYPIYQIAEMVGFNDYKYFCSKFKSYTGYSVTELVKNI